jgi:hypothetical protein
MPIHDGIWKRFDPTPEVNLERPSVSSLFLDSVKLRWTRYVVGFSSDDQKAIFRNITFPFSIGRLAEMRPGNYAVLLLLSLCSVLAVGVLLGIRRLRSMNKYGFITKGYLEFRKSLEKKGVTVSEATTSGDIRKRFSVAGMRKDVEEFITMYEDNGFGNRELTGERKQRYSVLLSRIKSGQVV